MRVTLDPTSVETLAFGIPTQYVLEQNYPNPFNPMTHIRFGLPQAGDVLVEVYNLLGQKVITLLDEYKAAGYHEVDFELFSKVQSSRIEVLRFWMFSNPGT